MVNDINPAYCIQRTAICTLRQRIYWLFGRFSVVSRLAVQPSTNYCRLESGRLSDNALL